MAREDRWKEKYFAALENTEAVDKQLESAESLLRQTISRLTVAANGNDSLLDAQLAKLRKISRKKITAHEISDLLDQIATSIKRLDTELTTGKLRRLPTNLVLAKLLAQLDLPKPLHKKSRDLDKKLRDKNAPADLENCVSAFSALLSESLDAKEEKETKKQPTAKNSSETNTDLALAKSVFNVLLQNLASQSADTRKLREDLAAARNRRDLEVAATTLVDIFKQAARPEKTNSEAKPEHGYPESPISAPASSLASAPKHSARELFATFLSALPLPNGLDTEARQIRDELLESANDEDWPEIVGEIANIVSRLRDRLEKERDDLQSFVIDLTEQLLTIDASLSGTEKQHQASIAISHQLDEAVQADLDILKSGAADATDLDSLRLLVDTRMSNIYEHLRDFKTSELEHQKALTEEMQTLRSQVQSMESKANNLQENLAKEREHARTDSLTGLMNRSAYNERLAKEYQDWKTSGKPLSLIVCDIDRFKKLNDALGHQAGDKALQAVATVLKGSIRQSDFLARYGGEEFVILIGNADTTIAASIAEQLRSEVESAEFNYQGNRVPITISCGYTGFRAEDKLEDAFKRADKCLYQAKENGRNCTVGG